MKILYLISKLESCGPVHQLYNIVRYLDRSRFEPIILTLSPEPTNTLMPFFKKEKIQVRTLGMTRIRGVLVGNGILLRTIDDISPKLIHSHGFRPDLLSADILRNYLRISTLHNYPYQDYPPKYGFGGYLMAAQHIRALRRIPCRVSVSMANRKKFLRHGIDFSVVVNGVDTDRFFPVWGARERLVQKEKLNLPPDKKIFISVGSLIYRKDPKTIIRGFMKSAVFSKAILVLLGEGHLRKSCEKISANCSAIKYVGQVLNVRDYLQVADGFVSSSKAEGMPTAVLEALACGIPVCLSDIPEHEEIIKYAIDDIGINFKKSSPDDCARAIDSFGDMDQERMRRNAVKVATEHLSAKIMSESYQKLYEEIEK